MFRKPSAMTIIITVIGIALVAAFDHAMRINADNLCSNDATAYDGCQDR